MKRRKKIQLKCWIVFPIIVGIATAITAFIGLDDIPATDKEYQPLEQMAREADLENLSSDVKIGNGYIMVEFENDQCAILARYSVRDLRLVSITKKDYAISAKGKYLTIISLMFVTVSISALVLYLIEIPYKRYKK